jgi:hypothetical protein
MRVLANMATPPKVGVGVSCELLLIGSAIRPFRLQIFIITGIDLQVMANDKIIETIS